MPSDAETTAAKCLSSSRAHVSYTNVKERSRSREAAPRTSDATFEAYYPLGELEGMP